MLDDIDVHGRMVFASEVQVIDISGSGLSVRIDHRLNVGQHYILKLADQKRTVSVRGTVVWCRLKETRQIASEEFKPVYIAGMEFEAMESDRLKDITAFITEHRKEGLPVYAVNEKRMEIRFSITIPGKAILHFPTNSLVSQR